VDWGLLIGFNLREKFKDFDILCNRMLSKSISIAVVVLILIIIGSTTDITFFANAAGIEEPELKTGEKAGSISEETKPLDREAIAAKLNQDQNPLGLKKEDFDSHGHLVVPSPSHTNSSSVTISNTSTPLPPEFLSPSHTNSSRNSDIGPFG
jgi:hypothetical protein